MLKLIECREGDAFNDQNSLYFFFRKERLVGGMKGLLEAPTISLFGLYNNN